MDSIQSGSMVRLKSGGPAMMVRMLSAKGDFACVNWFVGDENREAWFAVAQLVQGSATLPDAKASVADAIASVRPSLGECPSNGAHPVTSEDHLFEAK